MNFPLFCIRLGSSIGITPPPPPLSFAQLVLNLSFCDRLNPTIRGSSHPHIYQVMCSVLGSG